METAGDTACQGVCVYVCVSTQRMVLQYIYIQHINNGSFQSVQSEKGEGEVHSDTHRQPRGRWSTLTNTRDIAFHLLIDRWPLNDYVKVKKKKKRGRILFTTKKRRKNRKYKGVGQSPSCCIMLSKA